MSTASSSPCAGLYTSPAERPVGGIFVVARLPGRGIITSNAEMMMMSLVCAIATWSGQVFLRGAFSLEGGEAIRLMPRGWSKKVDADIMKA